MTCCVAYHSKWHTSPPPESQMFPSHAESAHLCPFPPMMCSLSHLLSTTCGANNTVKAFPQPPSLPIVDVAQFLSCQLFNGLVLCGWFGLKFAAVVLKWKYQYESHYDICPNWTIFVKGSLFWQKSRVCETTRNKGQESSRGFSPWKKMYFDNVTLHHYFTRTIY